jgi:hypothetical protein
MEIRVVHLETVVQSVFGLLDENGDVVQQIIVKPGDKPGDPLIIKKFNENSFIAAFNTLQKVREDIQKQQQG